MKKGLAHLLDQVKRHCKHVVITVDYQTGEWVVSIVRFEEMVVHRNSDLEQAILAALN